MKKRLASIFLALTITMSQGCLSFADRPVDVNDNKNIESFEEFKRDVKQEDVQQEGGNIYSEGDQQNLSPLLKDFKKNLEGDKIEVEKVVYFVEYESAQDKETVLQSLKKIEDTKVLYEYNIIFQGCSVETWPKNLDALKMIKGVKSVERAGQLSPLMNNARKNIGIEDVTEDYLKAINANGIDKHFDGRGMLISHIDTGMDSTHRAMRIDPDALPAMKLKNNHHDPFWVSDKVPHAFNYMNGGTNTIEKYDDGSAYYDPHGMHIAGILAANDTDDLVKQNRGIKGVAPNAQLLSYKMYSDASDAFAGDETMFHAFEDSIKLDADVVSISSGFTGTGLVGEKYWPAIRAMRKAGIPVFVATGNFATSSSNSSWDRYANNALGMTDTGNVTRTAAHEDAIAVGSSRNTVVYFPTIKIANQNLTKDFRYSQIGAFFDQMKFLDQHTNKKAGKYTFVYLGKCQDEDIQGRDLRNKIVVMDRIYTKDLKYAFKKVQDKGAKLVVVVNTVSYYNRDDWENIPAMGYEKDENTSMQVISLSGYDGAELWDMMQNKVTHEDSNTTARGENEYRVDMQQFNSRKPKVGATAELDVEFSDELQKWEENYQVPAGSTSWGPRTDLMLKPDISAPGKNIYSTLNKVNGKDDYAYMSGTSMATPVAAGASVLIRPKLKEMVESPVLKSANIDLSSLTKIVMQNSATPMIDPSTAKDMDITTAFFASPRQQGAGVINVARALKTDVIASFKVKDSVGEYNSYGAVSLKEIRGGSKDFTIDLYNTSDKDVIFDVTASPVTTDGEKQVTKLDEEYIDDNHKEGKQVVAEIHPVKVDGAEIIFKAQNGQVTVPAHGSYQLNATIQTGAAADADKFVESFINFTSHNQELASISMPLMGFAGDWNKEPIIDKWAWEEGSLSGSITVFDDNGKPKRPGTLNYGAGGEHGVDNFHPAGVIQNTEDGNPNFKQDPEYFAMNTSVDTTTSKASDSNLISGKQKKLKVVDQNGKEKEIDANDFEVNNAGLTPSPLVLRSASESKIYIANEEGRNLRTMAVQHFVKGILNSKRNTAKGLKDGFKKVWGDLKWDGTVYNSHLDLGLGDITGDLDQVAEGLYYYTFEYRLTPDYPWQKTRIPIKVDNTSPTIDSIDLSDADNIVIKANDTYHKAKDLSNAPNGVYFLRDQKQDKDRPENEKLFQQADSKVWYVGAGFVDSDNGYVTKNFNVIRTSDGEYVIRDANRDLIGKTLEIVAVDGAGNFAPTLRVVFDDDVNTQDNKLHYTLNEYDSETEEFKSIGQGIVGGQLKSESIPNVPDPENPDQGEEEEELDGAPVISIEKAVSTLGEMRGKRAKGKEFTNIRVLDKSTWTSEEKETWISTGEDCPIKDESGNPKYYDVVEYDNKYYHTKVLEDGDPILFIWSEAEESGNPEEYARQKGCKLFPIELEEVSTEDLERDGKFKIELNESDGFSVIGSLTNVDRNTKVYFQSKNMRNIRKRMKKEISTFDYDKDQHTMKFDFYGNRADVDTNSNPFNYDGGEIYIWAVNDNGEKSKRVTLVMPDAKKSDGETDPLLASDDYKAYSSMLRNIEELKGNGNGGIAGGDKGQPTILAIPTGQTVRNEDTKEDHAVFALRDKLKVKKGYAVRIISYNAGKMSLEALSDKMYAIDPSKMTKPDYEFGEEGRNGERFIDINILQGFNALRFEIYKPDVDSQGNFVGVERDSNGEITKIPEDKLVFEKGRCVYFDKEPVTFELNSDTFNPYVPENDKPILYSKTSPMTIRGTIGDKGGFMWHLRMNHHIIDEYLIYGDLKVNNTRDFSFTTDVRDGDVLDIGVKDYSGNTFPEKTFKSLDGEIKKQMPSQYKIYIDNKKPEIAIETKETQNITTPMYTLSTQGESSVLKIQVSDKISSGEEGRLQEIFVTVNGQAVTKGDTILEEAKPEKPWKIVVTASDYAKNKTVQKYEYNGNELRKIVQSTRKVIFDLNGGQGMLFDTGNELTINEGEDCFLPYLRTITPPSEKVFEGWEVVTTDSAGAEVKVQRQPGDILYVEQDTHVKALWKDKAEKEQVTITLQPDTNSKIVKTVRMDKGSVYRLPDATYLVKKEYATFEGWTINGTIYQADDTITVDEAFTAIGVWKTKEGQDSSSSGSSSSSKPQDNKVTKPIEQPVPNVNPSNQSNDNADLSIDQLAQKYHDISSHWAKNAIALCLQKGYFVGTSNSAFEPNKSLSRAEFVTAFGKFTGDTLEDGKILFKDVKQSDYYAPYTVWSNNKNLMIGYNGYFRPQDNMTREEMCVVLAKYLKEKQTGTTTTIVFKDSKTVSPWAKSSVDKVLSLGIMKGRPDGTFGYQDNITRAELAQILQSLVEMN